MEDRVMTHRVPRRPHKPIRLTASRGLLPWTSELGLWAKSAANNIS